MNDNNDDYRAYEKRLARDKVIYKLVFVFTLGLIIFSVWFAYESTQNKRRHALPPSDVLPSETGGKQVKPLPDFIIDKVQPDELEQLKP